MSEKNVCTLKTIAGAVAGLPENRLIGKTKAHAVLVDAFDAIGAALRAGDTVKINGFGRFFPVETGARLGRNPKTGEPAQIAAKRRAKFKASNKLMAGIADLAR